MLIPVLEVCFPLLMLSAQWMGVISGYTNHRYGLEVACENLFHMVDHHYRYNTSHTSRSLSYYVGSKGGSKVE